MEKSAAPLNKTNAEHSLEAISLFASYLRYAIACLMHAHVTRRAVNDEVVGLSIETTDVAEIVHFRRLQ